MIKIKTDEEIQIMADGGAKLRRIKNSLKDAVKQGVKASEIEALANRLIGKEGAEASFKKVKGYKWATCVNVNSGLVHGIPSPLIVFQPQDVVSVDVGIFYKGFHTDTSFTIALDPSKETNKFLNAGKEALNKAISYFRVGKHVYDISKAIQTTVEATGYSAIRALVGHGVGKELHEDPQIPCFVPGEINESPKIENGMVFAIEVMYAQGSSEVEISEDGWTIATKDGKMSGLFEETVALIGGTPKVLT